ncbi:alpha/beta hydrolase [Oceanobacter mangrovi]|uniref:alpha/beta hydrolase n=1 Tax=Oceanobacter mangrovi TaxID=2862510 RepID=UPI001C8D6CC5|nr:alpha/beta fold hydrolase [Oceanobacter mangrovi]
MSGVKQPAAILNRDSITVESVRPMVLFLHGNGENISTHIGSVAWLVYEGVDVFALDYRGYGGSEGNALLPDVLQDIDAAAGWLRQQYPQRPLVVLGQSMGAGLALIFGHEAATHYNVRAVIAEAAPASYSRAAREILSRNPLGWFVWPFTWLLPEQWNPENFTANYPVPVLLLHSRDDQVVGYDHGRKLFDALGETACWQDTAGPHIAGFASSTVRQRVLKFIRIGGC